MDKFIVTLENKRIKLRNEYSKSLTKLGKVDKNEVNGLAHRHNDACILLNAIYQEKRYELCGTIE